MSKEGAETNKIRIGIVGARRGLTFQAHSEHVGMTVVAVCDIWEERLQEAGKKLNVATYKEYDKFLEHDMDAVILANYFHEHAPFAVKALKAGKHVMSETSACKTLAEGVALAREVEKTGRIYMIAENYPYFLYNQEMRRLYQAGEIGEMQFGEGEYIHPISAVELNKLAPGMNHWRSQKPATYYCTHALAPLMYITDLRPVSVNAQCIPFFENDEQKLHTRVNDTASTILCRMNNSSLAVLNGTLLRGHGNWYRVHGTRGRIENLRTGNSQMVRITHESWDCREGDVAEKIYLPKWPSHGDLANKSGHGGGDFFTDFYFAEAIRKNEQPYLNVYRAIDMSIVGIQAYKSALENGAPYEIPDFRNEETRKKYEYDHWSPYPEDRRPGQPYPSIKGKIEPSREAVELAKKNWIEMGYKGE